MTTRKYLIKLTKLTLRALAKSGEGSLACKIQVPGDELSGLEV